MAPKSATTEPPATVCSRTGCTGVSLMVVRCGYVWVKGAVPGEAGDRRRRPARLVEAGLRPPVGVVAPVHPFHEVAHVGVALRRGEPFGGVFAPRPVRARARRVMPSAYQRESCRSRPGEEAGRPCPGPYHRWRTPRALVRPAFRARGQVHRPDVLLVGVREARPGVNRRAVDVQAVGVCGRDIGDGPAGAIRRVASPRSGGRSRDRVAGSRRTGPASSPSNPIRGSPVVNEDGAEAGPHFPAVSRDRTVHW